jgi:hypothetical protein
MICLSLVAVAGCGKRAQMDKQRTQVETEAAAKRAATAERLKGLDVPGLAAELQQDSLKGVEPFNSPAYKQLVGRGAAAGPALAPLVGNDAPSSFLGLLALRQVDPARYHAIDPALRVKLLVDTLHNAKRFNTFGLPHTRREPAARAIIEEGRAAIRPLSALLGDKRPAPVWGSEDYVEYKRHGFRVCDYALGFLLEILGKKDVAMPVDPAARDKLIESLQAEIAQPPPPG